MRLKVLLVVIFVISVVILAGPLIYKKTSEIGKSTNSEQLKSSNVVIFDDHQEILNVIDDLTKSGKLGTGQKTLVNFDYHSDTVRDNEHFNRIYSGNWTNVLISKGIVNEVYWILPDETLYQQMYGDPFWGKASTKATKYFQGGKEDESIYVDPKTGKLYFDLSSKPEGYNEVKFHKRTVSDLPDFKGQNNIILTVDADFFNCIFGITNTLEIEPPSLESKFKSFLDKLSASGMKPTMLAWSRSVMYTGNEFIPELNNFYEVLKSRIQLSPSK